jgi:protein-tyrosine kinase
MSRIHDALKRAEQEKAALKPTGEQPVGAGVLPEMDGSALYSKPIPIATNHGPDTRRQGRTHDGVGVQYSELIQRCAHPEWKASEFGASLSGDSGKIVAERFRTLRSRLYQIAALRPLKRVLITSSVPGEGKTFVATNLVRSIIRQQDRRVLLIDADLRAPRVHTALGAPSSLGLSDYLRGEASEYAIVQNSAANNLCFIACGTAFDWVILDSPPSLPVHDASNLAGSCDGVLFVVHAGKTDNEIALKASTEFRNRNLLGVVLNQVEASESQGGYYYGHTDGV